MRNLRENFIYRSQERQRNLEYKRFLSKDVEYKKLQAVEKRKLRKNCF